MSHYVKNNMAGFALLTVLIMMQIVALLGLYALQASVIAEHSSRMAWQQMKISLQAEEILQSIAQQLLAHLPPCLIPITASVNLQKKTLDEWRSSRACTAQYQGADYYYVVEALGEVPCAHIENSEMTGKTAHYFRITLFIIQPSTATKEKLQATVIQLADAESHCNGTLHQAKVGLQTWLELR